MGRSSDYSVVESMTRVDGPFEPASDRIPADASNARDDRLVEAFDTEAGDFVEGRATMSESMERTPGVRAKSLAAGPASESTAPSRFGPAP
jgi:hypothetical protein